MPKQGDRSVIKFGPARLEVDKAIQREIDSLRSEIETKQPNVDLSDYPTTSEVEDIVTEIITEYPPIPGGGGFIVGLPPGSQFAYVPANLVQYPMNLKAVRDVAFQTKFVTFAEATTEVSGRIEFDVSNVLGYGENTLITYDSRFGTIIAFSPDDQLVATVNVPLMGPPVDNVDQIGGFFSINGGLVSYSHIAPFFSSALSKYVFHVYIYDGTDFNIVELSSNAPTNNSRIIATGPSLNRDSFFIVWATQGGTSIKIDEYSVSGTLIGTVTRTIDVFQSYPRGEVRNGWIVIPKQYQEVYNPPFTGSSDVDDEFIVLPATTSSVTDIRFFECSYVSSQSTFSFDITEQGVLFSASYYTPTSGPVQVDLVRMDYYSNTSEVYPGVIYNELDPTPRPQFASTQITGGGSGGVMGCVAVDGRSVFFTSASKAFDGTNYYAIPTTMYIVFTEDENNPGLYVPSASYTTHDDYPTNLGTSSTTVIRIGSTAHFATMAPDGNITYHIGNAAFNNSGLSTSSILFKVDPTP